MMFNLIFFVAFCDYQYNTPNKLVTNFNYCSRSYQNICKMPLKYSVQYSISISYVSAVACKIYSDIDYRFLNYSRFNTCRSVIGFVIRCSLIFFSISLRSISEFTEWISHLVIHSEIDILFNANAHVLQNILLHNY